MAKVGMNLENPKTYLASMLFFGCVFVLLGAGVDALTAIPTLSQAGWILIVVSVCLWMFELGHKKH